MQRLAARRMFVRACSMLALIASPLHADISATVNVDAANVRATMSSMGLGLHTSPYYNAMNHALADLNDSGNKQSNEPYWNDAVLSQPGIADHVDFVMVHWYPWAGN